MKPTLLLIHGRSQEGRDPTEIKTEWLNALRLGLGPEREAVLEDVDIRLPYYGDILNTYSRQMDSALPQDVAFRGSAEGMEDAYLELLSTYAAAIELKLALTRDQVRQHEDPVKCRGALNWSWTQAVMRAADVWPNISATSIALSTRDVYLYLSRTTVMEKIDPEVLQQVPEGPTVVIGHSLGSVVGYSVLKRLAGRTEIPLYLTVGSPLGIGPIARRFQPLVFPIAVGRWFNAFDDRDVVALNPLTPRYFAVDPAIENYCEVKNQTANAHGISGYLNDPTVASQIFAALTC
jgi:hypothetical protein